MVSTSLFRVLTVVMTLAPIALVPTGCAEPCGNCTNIDCSGRDIDCSSNNIECLNSDQSNKAGCVRKEECEAKKKETIMACEKYKSICFKSCG
jgi:hypothetical protein